MKQGFTSFILAIILCEPASAQPFLKGKQEVTTGWGYYTHEQVVNVLEYGYGSRMTTEKNNTLNTTVTTNIFGGAPQRLDSRIRTGAIFVNYYFTPITRYSIGIGAGYESEQATIVPYLPMTPSIKPEQGRYSRKIFTIAPETRIYYTNNKLLKLYFMFGLGRSFVFETAESDISGKQERRTASYWRFQLSPIGVMVGNTIRGFAEVGYGYKGVARVGVSWKF